jgi:GH24 family phage-related lysozyme (muramidase)
MTAMRHQLRLLAVLFTVAGALALGSGAAGTADAAEAALPNLHRQLSDRGLSFLERHEGFVGHLYNDSAGNCTIGYGHLLHHGACGSADRARYRQGITRGKARELLRRDVDVSERSVQRHVRVALNQHQFDALVSFAFNVGTGAFEGSTLLRLLNQRHYDQVPAQLMRWTIGGLEQRRADEVRLWRDGRYS